MDVPVTVETNGCSGSDLLMGEEKELITRLESVDAEQTLSAVLHGQSKLALHIRSLGILPVTQAQSKN